MSANIYWRPLKNGKDLDVSAPSSFMETFAEIFGSMPRVLTAEDYSALIVASKACSDLNFKKHFSELAEAVEKHEEIEVHAVW